MPRDSRRSSFFAFASTGAALFALGLLMIVLGWAYTVQRVRTEIAEATTNEINKNANLALALDVQTDQLLKGIDQILLLLKAEHERPGPWIPLERLIGSAADNSDAWPFVGVLDEHGDVVDALEGLPPFNAADRPMFQFHQSRDTGKLLISAPMMGRSSGRWAIIITRRINKPEGSFGGLAAISIEPRYLTKLFEQSTLGPRDIMSLVLDNGVTLARRRGGRIIFGEDISGSQLLDALGRATTGHYTGPGGVDGVVRMFSYRLMTDYPIVATVGTSEADALGPVRRRARVHYLTAAFASAFLLAICATGWVLLSKQERTNRQIREQASLLDKAQDGIIVIGLDQRVAYWNRGAERTYGWTSDEAVGRTMTALLGLDDEGAAPALEQVVRTGEWSGEFRSARTDGRRVFTESRWTLVRDARGEARTILTINTDITERRALEAQFLRAQRLESIGTMAAGIAHDLNNVLTPVMLAADALLECTTDVESREMLTVMSGSANRGAAMIRDLLAFGRGQDGPRVELDANALIADVSRIIRDTLPKALDIRTVPGQGVPRLLGDPTQLHQVLVNLCVNASDAMPDGGQLTLSSECEVVGEKQEPLNIDTKAGTYVVLQVADTGVGMSPEVVDRIFDPFFTTKELGQGTGLGLSTSVTIVKSHGGYVQVHSEPGRGTRFRIYLPGAASVAAPAPECSRAARPRGHGETVLVVDDESAIRVLLERMLKRAGYQVRLAADGAEAVSIYTADHASIVAVLIDMTMPVRGGASAIQALIAFDPDVRIIAASGIGANEPIARAAGPQVKRFLQKPYSAETLARALNEVLAD